VDGDEVMIVCRVSASIGIALLAAGFLVCAYASSARAQAGSTGGMIGKTDKSVSGGGDEPAPPKLQSKAPARPRSADKKLSSDDKGTGRQKVFANPTINGIRVDWYSGEGNTKGQPAADAWCRSKGFTHSTSFAWEFHSPAIRIATRTTCSGFCGAFTKVVCE
jgi:hypothetical protein